MAMKEILDLLGADVLASPNDEIFLASSDGEISFVVDLAQITRVEISFRVEGGQGLIPVRISEHYFGSAHGNLSFLADAECNACHRVTDADAVVDDAAFGGGAALDVADLIYAKRDRGDLAAAVYAKGQAVLKLCICAANGIGRHRCTARDKTLEGRKAKAGAMGSSGEFHEERRRTDAKRDLMIHDAPDGLISIPSIHENDLRADERRCLQCIQVTGDVSHRGGHENYIALAELPEGGNGGKLRRQCIVAVQYSLRHSRRSRRIKKQLNGVRVGVLSGSLCRGIRSAREPFKTVGMEIGTPYSDY